MTSSVLALQLTLEVLLSTVMDVIALASCFTEFLALAEAFTIHNDFHYRKIVQHYSSEDPASVIITKSQLFAGLNSEKFTLLYPYN